MRALVTAGARQEIGSEDRRDQPGEHDDFENARHAAHREIGRERNQRDRRADQPRRDKGTVTRGRQRVVLHRGVHQRIDVIADRIEQLHVFLHVRPCERAPLITPGIVSDAT